MHFTFLFFFVTYRILSCSGFSFSRPLILNQPGVIFQPTEVLSKPRRAPLRGSSKDDMISIWVLVKTFVLLMRSLRLSTSTENQCIVLGQCYPLFFRMN